MADVINLPGGEPGGPSPLLLSGGSLQAQVALDLAVLKDDLGMPATSENDAWLERRVAGVWARFERYTSRSLAVPPAQFIDDWGQIASTMAHHNQPPVLDQLPIGSPFLRCCPVVSIDAIESNLQTLDPAGVSFEKATGKLFTLHAPSHGSHDVSRELRHGRVKITYKAGWDEIPADLYEALVGVLSVMWQQRLGQQAGGGAGLGGVSGINVIDVGSVELSDEGNAFVASATRGTRIEDPLLGPWGYLLQEYIDYRVQIGSPLIPTTVYVPAPP